MIIAKTELTRTRLRPHALLFIGLSPSASTIVLVSFPVKQIKIIIYALCSIIQSLIHEEIPLSLFKKQKHKHM